MELLTAVFYLILLIFVYKILDYIVRLPRIGRLQDRCIFVSGCDTGFGHAVTKKLIELGCTVFAGCLTEAGETSLRKACPSRLTTLSLDVTDPKSIAKAQQQVREELGDRELWGIINNAGVGNNVGPPDWLMLDDYKKTLAVNLYGMIEVTKAFLPLLKKSGGRVVNMSSSMGRLAVANCAPYAISKFGVEAYSDCLRRAMQPFGVSVHIIAPGFHNTSIVNKEVIMEGFTKAFNRATPEVQQEYGQQYIDDNATWLDEQLKVYCTMGVDDVVDADVHALLGRFPRARYVVGWDARYLTVPLSWAPEWLQDMAVSIGVAKPAISKRK